MNWIDFNGKVALVTEATGEIGKSIAKELGELNARLVITGRDNKKLEAIKEELKNDNIQVEQIVADLSRSEDVKNLVRKSLEKFGKIDIVICNASAINDKVFLDLSEEDWDYIIRVNLTSVFILLKEVVPIMIKQKYGKIVIVTSIVGITGGLGKANLAYTASKAGLIGVTKNLAKNLAKYNITVNAVAPSFILSEMLTKSNITDKYKNLLDLIPVGRFGTPEDVANAVVFLASDRS
jgi:3-oxoacyl-[acyl-carrier protein] reductase